MGQVARHKAARVAAKRQAPVLVYRIRRREQALERARRWLARLDASLDARYVAMQKSANAHNVGIGAFAPGRTCVLH